MSFDSADYVGLAKLLAAPSSSPSLEEAKLRTAISRAYYGAFLKARDHIRVSDPSYSLPPSPDIHKLVVDYFKRHSSIVARSVGTNLDRLRISRNQADYDCSTRVLVNDADFAIIESEGVLSVLAGL